MKYSCFYEGFSADTYIFRRIKICTVLPHQGRLNGSGKVHYLDL